MLNIKKAMKSRRLLRALTGLDKEKFNILLVDFERVYLKTMKSNKLDRQRAYGGGRKHTLESIELKLFYILFYLKVYPTFDLAGFIFNSNRGRTHEWFHTLLPILEETLNQKCLLPKRKVSTVEEFLSHFPTTQDLFIDVTERPTQRRKKDKLQKREYSGKKKRHTKKSLLVANEKKEILLTYKSRQGSQHDKKILEKSQIPNIIPKDVTVWVDLGFQGLNKQKDLDIMIPHKKPKGKELTTEQKQENQTIASIRIVVENAICGVKRYNSVSQIYRNKKAEIDDKMFQIACGLWNLHLRLTA
jgi:hypothetical protein